jgi:hypothetical protein
MSHQPICPLVRRTRRPRRRNYTPLIRMSLDVVAAVILAALCVAAVILSAAFH